MTIPNLPLPDELADIRAKIKDLEEREAAIKQLLLANPDVREGAAWLAEVKVINTTYTDLAELRKMHPDLVAEYVFPKQVTRIVLSGITTDGELIPARRFRAATESHQT